MIVDLVYGTRPNIIKAAALHAQWRETREQWPFELRLIDTGQHWDDTLSADQCRALGLPTPAFNLQAGHRQSHNGNIAGSPHTSQRSPFISTVAQAYGALLTTIPPTATIAIGDVNGSVGVARAAHQHHVPLFHLEAGLRGGIDAKAEEANRYELDQICDYLWAPDDVAAANLGSENIPKNRITVTGNIMIDALLRFAPLVPPDDITQRPNRSSVLVTLHRAENIDDPVRFKSIVRSITEIAQTRRVIWPLHPRTKPVLTQLGLPATTGLTLLPPLPYPAFTARLNAASIVVTDSGGILEECAYLGKPAVIVRPHTERPHAVAHCGFEQCEPTDMVKHLDQALRCPPTPFRPQGWDGKAAMRMLQDLTARLQNLPA
ncbi:UDP-N-acetyl glucosamine 2-epimerase [Thalassospira mesophila]|uniref:UDP-N-acetylglucosamine 2-epimerase domain-containing protein n=1 Tax=Thalassospira mesophila TaxID=1293891 RepID=A0A1Y2KZ74_9PROT|nr:UDP-N-acetylglucosamine 2-epimerase [Thalassospira mesophila]OSQ37471.1 hypothetical protein TMES_14850 [Thalassospira mesophila]